ncbi:hypothetical protein ADK75_36315 [Streptomyces virginiae]|uniref:Uncharacterized protein n=1 Tax=Streptomyces virginiae TaxID=1961 RepID=A0A0L8M1W5_STRVG|nr:hypothetical protein ADK75_36315 [Streptomyces virginiae]
MAIQFLTRFKAPKRDRRGFLSSRAVPSQLVRLTAQNGSTYAQRHRVVQVCSVCGISQSQHRQWSSCRLHHPVTLELGDLFQTGELLQITQRERTTAGKGVDDGALGGIVAEHALADAVRQGTAGGDRPSELPLGAIQDERAGCERSFDQSSENVGISLRGFVEHPGSPVFWRGPQDCAQ